MDYAKARPQIATGDLIAFRNRGPFARMIRMRTGSDYSHVGVALRLRLPEEGEDGVYMVDSHARTGFRIRRLSTLKRFDWMPVVSAGVLQWTPAAAQYAGRRLGVYAYGWWDILRAALGIPMRDDAQQTCQEFVAEIYRRCRIPRPEGAGLSAMLQPQSPGELIDRLRAWGADRTIEVRVK